MIMDRHGYSGELNDLCTMMIYRSVNEIMLLVDSCWARDSFLYISISYQTHFTIEPQSAYLS
jgi:hypothetical protein